ncbi:IgA Peptidase M64 [Pseudobythopirellula maris]|uniref:IgA Peptidase M64 n=1 Tax=Pseudobythopirellula maris TaxID=2527991 RepID=A0A5C5ZLC5_9BACT|nr:M64 family metallopeptidase [Pseudobythopirellula maris]TWT88242.1 IgA Peptidase M64 [Pseudobythopirellula maris]
MRHPRFFTLACFALTLLAGGAARTAFAQLTTLVQTGDPANRVDIVFLGDGYTQADHDAGLFDDHVGSYLDYLFGGGSAAGGLADPFPRYQNFFNVHQVEVVSNESGADKPPEGVFRDTALDAKYYANDIERLLTVSTSKANAALGDALAGTGVTADMRYTTVNDAKYGGSGGSWATFAGANPQAHEIALHEVGHAFADLADEYVSHDDPFPFGEPSEVNVTIDPTGQKWERWLGFDDPRGSDLDIGVYEGARYYATDVYRPSRDSKMRSLDEPYDAVSREAIIEAIYAQVDPIDDHLSNLTPLLDPETLWVEVIDPTVIAVDWYVDDTIVEGAQGSEFDPQHWGLAAGEHTVRALAYDNALDHAFAGGVLDLIRLDPAGFQQQIEWTVSLTATAVPGDYNGDGTVGVEDYAAWVDTYGSTNQLAADGNANGVVDAADFTVWRDHYHGATASAVSAAVPEPAALGLLASLCGAVLPRAHRQRG